MAHQPDSDAAVTAYEPTPAARVGCVLMILAAVLLYFVLFTLPGAARRSAAAESMVTAVTRLAWLMLVLGLALRWLGRSRPLPPQESFVARPVGDDDSRLPGSVEPDSRPPMPIQPPALAARVGAWLIVAALLLSVVGISVGLAVGTRVIQAAMALLLVGLVLLVVGRERRLSPEEQFAARPVAAPDEPRTSPDQPAHDCQSPARRAADTAEVGGDDHTLHTTLE